MSDLISRQAAIEVIDTVMPVDPNKSEYASGIACGAALAMTYVKQLPSAQPEVRTEMSSADTISRQAAIDALGGNEPVGDPSKMDDDDVVKMWERIRIINIINKLPSAQPIQTASNYLQSLPTSPLLVGKMPSAQPDRSLWFRIGELCVDESKGNITAEVAIKKIRALLRAERRTDD